MADAILPYPPHPFYPLEAKVAGYLANQWSVPLLLVVFFGGFAVILGTTLAIVTRLHSGLPKSDKAIILWFVLSGSIHFFFEGYFALNHTRMGPAQDLFGQLWKEYAFSDSRYLTSDPFVLCMETITAVCWGPLSYLAAYYITIAHPLRHPVQAIVSLGQLYGDVLYYATSMFDLYYKGVSYCRPEAYYFWFYYVFMNAFWIVIPLALLYQSSTKTARAFKALDKAEKALATNGLNGHVKKNS